MRLLPLGSKSTNASAPMFAAAGAFESLHEPFRAPLVIVSAAPGELALSTRVSAESATVPVHWEVARNASFQQPERYGLMLVHARDGHMVRVQLHGLERGRSYWARIWAGGVWSRPVRVRTGPRANGSSSLFTSPSRRAQRRAS